MIAKFYSILVKVLKWMDRNSLIKRSSDLVTSSLIRTLVLRILMSRDYWRYSQRINTKWAASWQNQQNGIRPVWLESSLSAWRKLGSLATYWTHSEDSDQTGRMRRLIWVVSGRTLYSLVLSCRGSFAVCLPLHSESLVSRIWTTTWQNQQHDCAPSEDSDQPGQSPSLIRVFPVR